MQSTFRWIVRRRSTHVVGGAALERVPPIVHVAIGSRANYFEAGTHPIDVACLPAHVLAFFRQSGLALPNDFAGGPAAGPAFDAVWREPVETLATWPHG